MGKQLFFRSNIFVFFNSVLIFIFIFSRTCESYSQVMNMGSTEFSPKDKNEGWLMMSSPEFTNIVPDSNKKSRRVELGFRSGINVSNMNFNKGYVVGYEHLSPVWRSGFHVGLNINIPLNDIFLITQEYSLSRIRGKYSPIPLYLTIDYLSIPLLLKYRVLSNTTIFFGPHFELLIDGSENNTGQISNISKTTEERSVGLTLGFEYFLTNHLFFNGRYMHGLNAIGLWQRNSRREFKYETFQMSLGYRFQ